MEEGKQHHNFDLENRTSEFGKRVFVFTPSSWSECTHERLVRP